MLYAKWMLKNKLFYVYLTLFLPFSILVPFYLIASEDGRSYVAIGTIVFTMLFNSLVTACQDLAADKLPQEDSRTSIQTNILYGVLPRTSYSPTLYRPSQPC